MSQAGVISATSSSPAIPTSFVTNAGTAVPVANILNILGASTAAGTSPVATTGVGNTVTVNVQKSQAIAATDATKVGLSNFNSTEFTVDANGFVSLIGGTLAVDSFAMQTGTSPVVPAGTGLVTFNGAVVAAGTNPVRTDGTGANTMALEIQIAQAIATTNATNIGLAAFASADFAVDANGFVSLSTTGAAKTITGDSGGPLSPSANNWNILGGPGVTTSGSGSTLTINSVVFTDQAGSTSVTSDSGSFATAAITLTLPAVPAQGELLEFVCTSASALVLDAPSTHLIRIGASITSAGGTMTSNAIGDSVTLRYRASDTTWYATSVIGTWTPA